MMGRRSGIVPSPLFNHRHGFMRAAGVYPSDFVLVESIWATLRLVASGRGLTIQPRMALEPAVEGTAAVPMEGVSIPVRWEAVARPDRSPETETLLRTMTQPITQ